MRTPDARPVGETAEHGCCICCDRCESVADQLGVNVRGLGGGNLDAWLCDDCDRAIRCEPSRAEARATLLAGAPTVWVATDRSASVSELSDKPFEMSNGVAFADEDADVVTIWNHPPLTPPGTVRRAYLVIPEGEETPT